MDSALQELLLSETDPDEIVEVIVRLVDEKKIPEKLIPIAHFGDVVTCRIRRGDILEVYRSRLTKSMKAPRFVAFNESFSADSTRYMPNGRAALEIETTGENTIVAVLDWGIDFAHPNFRNPDGSTRFLAIVDQSFRDNKGLAPYGYGRLFNRVQINRALKSKTPYRALRYHPGKSDALAIGTHGTHVTDIAAGNGRMGKKGLATKADLIFVHLASRGTEDTNNLGDSVRILEALDAVRNLAGNRNLVVNLSVGKMGGPHDGCTLVEKGIDNFLRARNNTMVCQSAGNYFQSRTHHSDIVRPGKIRKFSFVIDKADTTHNELEIWYQGCDTLFFEIINNATKKSFTCPINSKRDVVLNGTLIGRIYHRAKEPNNGKNHINLFLYKNAPSGRWTVKLKGMKVHDGRYHAWIERDGSCRNCQSRFDPSFAVSTSTTGTIANGYNTIVCGAYDSNSVGLRIAPFSSRGPTLDGRYKPDIIAPGFSILAAKSTPRTSQSPRPSLVRMSGTSMAAPRVTGATALVMQHLPAETPFWQIRNIILGSTDAVVGADGGRIGSGKLNVQKAVATAKRYRQQTLRLHRAAAFFGNRNTFRMPPIEDVAVLYDQEFGKGPLNDSHGFLPSYRTKRFSISNSNAILRDGNLVPLKVKHASADVGINRNGNPILVQGREYRILNVIKASSGNLIAEVATVVHPTVPLGWTVVSNFKGSLYNESLQRTRPPEPVSKAPSAFTVIDPKALVRNPQNGFKSTGDTIAIGTFVRLLQYDKHQKYAQVTVQGQSGTGSINDRPLWTSVLNLTKGWLQIFGANSAWKRGKFIGMVDLVDIVGTRLSIKQVSREMLKAYHKLTDDAFKQGVQITLNSGFRSYPDQEYLYSNYKKGVSGFNLAARPGRSNHQNGVAFDLNTTGRKGTGSGPVYSWLKKNATCYGFIRTVRSEHWHWEFRPKLAAKLNAQQEYRSWKRTEIGADALELAQEIGGEAIMHLDAHVPYEIETPDFDASESDNESYYEEYSNEKIKNLEKAIRANRRYGISLGWNVHHDKINELLLPFSDHQNVSLSEESFVYALAKWQRSNGFSSEDSDGILGPKTWRVMKESLGFGPRPVKTSPILPPTFNWDDYPNIKAKYRTEQAYRPIRRQVRTWGITNTEAYIESALAEWNAHPKIHVYFKSFDGDPKRSYLNLKRLYRSKGIPNPANYIATYIRRLTFFGKSSPGHVELKQKLATAEQRLRANGHQFTFNNAWSFVPRTFNNNINKLSNHSLGRAIDIDHQSNPHITNSGEIKVIDAICKNIFANGFLKERDPEVFLRASNHFKSVFTDQWAVQQTAPVIVKVLKNKNRMRRLKKYANLGFFTLSPVLVRALQDTGLNWGGTWSTAKDFMHFEIR